MKFSICIPNYNYAQYLPRTLESVFAQAHEDFEVLVSDNASTDESLSVIDRFNSEKIRVHRNACNIGFARNLDRAAADATGDFMIMLSSDDLMRPMALLRYQKLLTLIKERAAGAVVASSCELIDADGNVTGRLARDQRFWRSDAKDEELSTSLGADVYVAPASEILRRSLVLMRTPLPFLTTCYPRRLYLDVEGYGGERLYNPDKWFAWKLLSVAETVYFIDEPLFAYRIHDANQDAQQSKQGALKHLVDEYVVTFQLPTEALDSAGLSREDLRKAFVENDIALRGLKSLAEGDSSYAKRTVRFGLSVYPDEVAQNRKVWLLRFLLAIGPLGRFLAAKAKEPMLTRWRRREGSQARYRGAAAPS